MVVFDGHRMCLGAGFPQRVVVAVATKPLHTAMGVSRKIVVGLQVYRRPDHLRDHMDSEDQKMSRMFEEANCKTALAEDPENTTGFVAVLASMMGLENRIVGPAAEGYKSFEHHLVDKSLAVLRWDCKNHHPAGKSSEVLSWNYKSHHQIDTRGVRGCKSHHWADKMLGGQSQNSPRCCCCERNTHSRFPQNLAAADDHRTSLLNCSLTHSVPADFAASPNSSTAAGSDPASSLQKANFLPKQDLMNRCSKHHSDYGLSRLPIAIQLGHLIHLRHYLNHRSSHPKTASAQVGSNLLLNSCHRSKAPSSHPVSEYSGSHPHYSQSASHPQADDPSLAYHTDAQLPAAASLAAWDR